MKNKDYFSIAGYFLILHADDRNADDANEADNTEHFYIAQ